MNKPNVQGTIQLPDLDGVEIQPGVVIIGEVTPISNTNLLRALANVGGALCVVELRVCFKEVVSKIANGQPQLKVDIPLANPTEGE